MNACDEYDAISADCLFARGATIMFTGAREMADNNPKAPAPKPVATNKPKAPVKSKRQRFVDLHAKRVRNARRALRNVARMGNVAGYEYSADEAANIVKVIKEDAAEVERAFKGTPKEKGLYDL